MAPAITVGLCAIGLRHIIDHGGSGYFLKSRSALWSSSAACAPVQGAAIFRRPAPLGLPHEPGRPELLAITPGGLRLAATGQIN
jgi:hypothetical protein